MKLLVILSCFLMVSMTEQSYSQTSNSFQVFDGDIWDDDPTPPPSPRPRTRTGGSSDGGRRTSNSNLKSTASTLSYNVSKLERIISQVDIIVEEKQRQMEQSGQAKPQKPTPYSCGEISNDDSCYEVRGCRWDSQQDYCVGTPANSRYFNENDSAAHASIIYIQKGLYKSANKIDEAAFYINAGDEDMAYNKIKEVCSHLKKLRWKTVGLSTTILLPNGGVPKVYSDAEQFKFLEREIKSTRKSIPEC